MTSSMMTFASTPQGKYVVDIDKDIDITKLTPGARVALKNDSYTLHLCLPTKARSQTQSALAPSTEG